MMALITSQTGDLVQIFQNALSYTVALTTLQHSTENSSDLFLLALSISIVVFILVFLRNGLETARKDIQTRSDYMTGILGCLLFLVNLTSNIFTQFLSTICAQYVVSFTPTYDDPLINVLPTLAITLSLIWVLLYSLGLA